MKQLTSFVFQSPCHGCDMDFLLIDWIKLIQCDVNFEKFDPKLEVGSKTFFYVNFLEKKLYFGKFSQNWEKKVWSKSKNTTNLENFDMTFFAALFQHEWNSKNFDRKNSIFWCIIEPFTVQREGKARYGQKSKTTSK